MVTKTVTCGLVPGPWKFSLQMTDELFSHSDATEWTSMLFKWVYVHPNDFSWGKGRLTFHELVETWLFETLFLPEKETWRKNLRRKVYYVYTDWLYLPFLPYLKSFLMRKKLFFIINVGTFWLFTDISQFQLPKL